jgi:hypothetical protein
MNRPKFQERGKTVVRKKISVLLHPALEKLLAQNARSQDLNKSDLVAKILGQRFGWKPPKEQ